jgi:hypothetical protein
MDHINIYCDESRYTNRQDPYLVIGAVKFDRRYKDMISAMVKYLKHKHRVGGEFGWKHVSWSRGQFYLDLIDWFALEEEISFRCVVANKRSLWSKHAEDAFYVAYHQLLYHWMEPGYSYHIYLDRRKNVATRRLQGLRAHTERDIAEGAVLASMEEVESRDSLPVQVSDLLIGAVGYVWNDHTDPARYPKGSLVKAEVCHHLAESMGLATLRVSTWKGEEKFNVFAFGREW